MEEYKTNAVTHLLKLKKYDGPLEKVLNNLSDPKVQIKLYRALINKSFREPIVLKPQELFSKKKNYQYIHIFRNVYISLNCQLILQILDLYQHVDHPDKVTALLLYLGFSDGVHRSGLGTQIYSVKTNLKIG